MRLILENTRSSVIARAQTQTQVKSEKELMDLVQLARVLGDLASRPP
jgi:hypothetical protein